MINIPESIPKVIAKNITCKGVHKLLLPVGLDKPSINQSFYIFGKAGVGKSHQAALLMLEVLENNHSFGSSDLVAQWINVSDLLFQIRNSYGKQENIPNGSIFIGTRTCEEAIVRRLTTVPWLCLDDLGAEKTSDWTQQTLYLIINKRYENELTTIITSNASLEDLAEKMGDDRLPSRIAGMCSVVELTGRDRR